MLKHFQPELLYVTTSMLTGFSAHSVQIESMCTSFNLLLNNRFCLISPYVENDTKLFQWKKIRFLPKRRLFRYFFMILYLFISRRWVGVNVYTRDILLALTLYFLRANIVYEVHHPFKTRIGEFAMKLLKKRIRFVVISSALRKYLSECYGVSSELIRVAHDGVFTDGYDSARIKTKKEIREYLKLPLDKKIILYTGSIYKGGGFVHFETIAKHFSDVLCVAIGGSGEELHKCQEYFSKYNNVLFLRHIKRTKLIEYQVSADALLLPYTKDTPEWWCTSPMKLFEYMATGIPIIASNIGSILEVINDSNAFLYESNKDDSLIKAVSDCLLQTNLGTQKAFNALRLVEEKFTWQIRAKNIYNFIKKDV